MTSEGKARIERLLEATSQAQESQEFLDCFYDSHQLKEVLGLTDKEISERYAYGYQRFKDGDYATSIEIFTYLTNLDPLSSKVWIALGLSYAKTNDHDEALHAFCMASLLDPTNPVIYYQTAQSYLAVEETTAGIQALVIAIQHSLEKREHQAIKKAGIKQLKSLIKRGGG